MISGNDALLGDLPQDTSNVIPALETAGQFRAQKLILLGIEEARGMTKDLIPRFAAQKPGLGRAMKF